MSGTLPPVVDVANCTTTGTTLSVDWMIVGGILLGLICGILIAAVVIPWGRSP